MASSYQHINGNGTTVVKNGPGQLFNVCINSKGSTANNVTIYDNTAASGTVIAVIDTTSQIQVLNYDIGFSTGLTVVMATGTAGDVTISYA